MPVEVFSIAVHEGTIYAGTGQGVVALDIGSGHEIWRTDDDSPFSPTPAVANGLVYIGCGNVMLPFHDGENGHIHAFEADSGRERWSYFTGALIDSPAAVVGSVVYVGCRDRNLYALDAFNGRKRWSFATRYWIESSPVVVDGVVYLLNRSDIYALDAASGAIIWTYCGVDGDFVEQATPAVVDGVVYFSHANVVAALEATSGREIWSFNPNMEDPDQEDWIDASPAVAGDTVYLSGRNRMWAIDALSGKVQWSHKYDSGRQSFEYGDYAATAPAVARGVVYSGNVWGHFYALDAATGDRRWLLDVGGYIRSSPVVIDGTVFLGSDNGFVFALDAANGRERWRYTPTMRPDASSLSGLARKGWRLFDRGLGTIRTIKGGRTCLSALSP
jgi:outer membrane protein assembly factor BamB